MLAFPPFPADSIPMSIGLTGGMGCGKSTVLRLLRDHGHPVLDTDAVARATLQDDPHVRQQLRESFGDGILAPDGMVDRAALAHTVFSDPARLSRLEAIVHPVVRASWTRFLADHSPQAVVEIPLLFEKQLQSHFSLTVCVAAAPEVQHQRLLARGMTPDQIHLRLSRQMPLPDKIRLAHLVLWNDGSLEHLRAQVGLLHERLPSLLRQPA